MQGYNFTNPDISIIIEIFSPLLCFDYYLNSPKNLSALITVWQKTKPWMLSRISEQ